MRFVPAIVAIGLALADAPPAPAQVLYSVNDLGSLYPGGGGGAFGVNASGQTTGDVAGVGQPTLAFRVSFGGQVTDPGAILGTLGGGIDPTRGGINDLGQVTGSSSLPSGSPIDAFRSSANGSGTSVTDLGSLAGFGSQGNAINNSGQVVGYSYVPNDINIHAFRTAPNGLIDSASDLGIFPGSSGNSVANAVNASGQVTGYAASSSGSVAFRTTATGTLATATDLGSLGGDGAQGLAINSSGQVAGAAELPGDNYMHAFISTPNGQPAAIEDLGTLFGPDANSLARGINSLGVVVGFCEDPASGSNLAFVFDTQMRSLSDLVPAGWTITNAVGINDAGQIAANGSFDGGPSHALLLTPVPEPGSLALLGAAAGGWALRRRKRLHTQ